MGRVVAMPPRGRYLAHEAGRLAGVSGNTIGQWARRGYIRSSASSRSPRVYSFQDVAEAMVVHELIVRAVPHRRIKQLIGELRERHGDWPLSHARLATLSGPLPGRGHAYVVEDDAVFDAARTDGWQATVGLDRYLDRVVSDLRRGGWAMRELDDVTRIEVDPDRLSGRPTLRGRRVPVEKVAELAESADGLKILREDYELAPAEIRDATRWWRATLEYESAA